MLCFCVSYHHTSHKFKVFLRKKKNKQTKISYCSFCCAFVSPSRCWAWWCFLNIIPPQNPLNLSFVYSLLNCVVVFFSFISRFILNLTRLSSYFLGKFRDSFLSFSCHNLLSILNLNLRSIVWFLMVVESLLGIHYLVDRRKIWCFLCNYSFCSNLFIYFLSPNSEFSLVISQKENGYLSRWSMVFFSPSLSFLE